MRKALVIVFKIMFHVLIIRHKSVNACSKYCKCDFYDRVDCSGKMLKTVPDDLSMHTVYLNLNGNRFSNISQIDFRNLKYLQELNLTNNNIRNLTHGLFSPLKSLLILRLEGNGLTNIENASFQNLHELIELYLNDNSLSRLSDLAFDGLTSLLYLRLDGNHLTNIPSSALAVLPALAALWLSNNLISVVPEFAFYQNPSLRFLMLNNNRISTVYNRSFSGLDDIEIISLEYNNLSEMPMSFYGLSSLIDLLLSANHIEYLPRGMFAPNSSLKRLVMRDNPIYNIHHQAFRGLTSLTTLVLQGVKNLTRYPDLYNCANITLVKIDRSAVEELPQNLCQHTPLLKHLDLHSNNIDTIPDMSQCTNLIVLSFEKNRIMSLEGSPFKYLSRLDSLKLSINQLTVLRSDNFLGLRSLTILDLSRNKITYIDADIFTRLPNLKELDLGFNQLSQLPTKGLTKLTKINLVHNLRLEDLPSPNNFPRLTTLYLTYPYHCCEYIDSMIKSEKLQNTNEKSNETILFFPKQEIDESLLKNYSESWMKRLDNDSFGRDIADSIYENMEHEHGDYLPEAITQYFPEYEDAIVQTVAAPAHKLSCLPRPGPFMPCKDLFGWWSLRCGVWLTFILTLLGNGMVLFVVAFTSHDKMDVTRFLVCNLAIADFIMGIYLGILAVVDAYTLGTFKKHGVDWQLSAGCQAAGFLAVLSNEMSIFILTVITIERFYAITHAMQIDKRLSLHKAAHIVLLGWVFSAILAALPLFNIGDYRTFAVCLPFKIDEMPSLVYVCFLLIYNEVSLLIIIFCYATMYCSIHGTQIWMSCDMRIARRMALLVLTDIACQAPVTFLALAAIFGLRLVTLEEAKILTIFVMPLNSCANPFLYVIFTKQFRRDCVSLCKRIEESNLSQRLTHFSNLHFSWSRTTSRRLSASNGCAQADHRLSHGNLISKPATDIPTPSNSNFIPMKPLHKDLWVTRRGRMYIVLNRQQNARNSLQ